MIIRALSFASFILPAVLFGQTYLEIGVSVPDSKLNNAIHPGPLIGVNHVRKLGSRASVVGHFSSIVYIPRRFPEGAARNSAGSIQYRLSVIPMMTGFQFHPLRGRFTDKLFVQASIGGQILFFSSKYSGFQESRTYRSRELTVGYSAAIGYRSDHLMIIAEKLFIGQLKSEAFVSSPNFYNLKILFSIQFNKNQK